MLSRAPGQDDTGDAALDEVIVRALFEKFHATLRLHQRGYFQNGTLAEITERTYIEGRAQVILAKRLADVMRGRDARVEHVLEVGIVDLIPVQAVGRGNDQQTQSNRQASSGNLRQAGESRHDGNPQDNVIDRSVPAGCAGNGQQNHISKIMDDCPSKKDQDRLFGWVAHPGFPFFEFKKPLTCKEHQPADQRRGGQNPDGNVKAGTASHASHRQFGRRERHASQPEFQQVGNPQGGIHQSQKLTEEFRQVISFQQKVGGDRVAELLGGRARRQEVTRAPFEIEEPGRADEQANRNSQNESATRAAIRGQFRYAKRGNEEQSLGTRQREKTQKETEPAPTSRAIREQGQNAEGQEKSRLHPVQRKPEHVPRKGQEQGRRARPKRSPDGTQEQVDAYRHNNERGHAQRFGRQLHGDARRVPRGQQDDPEKTGGGHAFFVGETKKQFSVFGQVFRVDEMDVGVVHWKFDGRRPEVDQRG